MENNFLAKGSVWRKWDLQIQPIKDEWFCDIQNRKAEIKNATREYLKKAIEKEVSVVAITDHNCGVAIDSAFELIREESLDITVLPGVEIDVNTGFQILVIFNPVYKEKINKQTWEETVNHFLNNVCHLSSPVINSQGQAESIGGDIHEIIAKICKEDIGLPIFAHSQSGKGLFKKTTGANRIKFFELSIMGKYYFALDHKTDNDIAETKKIIKGWKFNPDNFSLIKTSDAHQASETGIGFTWIKADQTFNGLKQIIFEPEDRVKIQDNSPYENKKKIYFENLTIDGRVNFILPNIAIPLNSELVTVIGGRGSGKSALLEAFAFLNEEHLKIDQNGKKKIIEFYRDNEIATDPAPSFITKTTLVDKDSNRQEFQKQLSERENLELPFLYLGQEQLSGLATNDLELTKTICELIGIDVAELNQQTHIFKAREILAQIKNTNQSLSDILDIYKKIGFNETIDFEKWVASYLKKLSAQQKRLTSKETRITLEEINKKTQRGLKLKELVEQIDEVTKEINNLTVNVIINSLNKRLGGLYPDEKVTITPIDSKKQITELNQIQGRIKIEMDSLRKEIIEKKTELLNLGIKEDVNTLLQSSQTLQQQINNVSKDLENYKVANTQLSEFIKQRDDTLISVKSGLDELKERINIKFGEFRNSRNDSEAQEKELFGKIIQGIEIKGDIAFDEEHFCGDVLGNFVDNRKIKNENDLREEIAGKNPDGTAKRITLTAIASWVKQDLSAKVYFSRGGVDGILEYIFTNWPKFIRVRAVVKLNGKTTDVLSIGQRGTLLLKVFLATATAKQVFIIDQPEDNLDNNFIMQELVPLIRKAKVSRQIIMSTHNANLVVNADAEQVIIARLDNEGDYMSGSIENQIINKNIKDILEGGEEAFRSRENKYGMTIIH